MALDPATLAHLVRQNRLAIREAVPDAHVELTGSASVGGLDAQDVDLIVLADEPAALASALSRRYSQLYPEQWRDDWIAFRDDGPPRVDIVVTSPGSDADVRHRQVWELIASRVDLQDEYRRIKIVTPDREARKAAFFDRLAATIER